MELARICRQGRLVTGPLRSRLFSPRTRTVLPSDVRDLPAWRSVKLPGPGFFAAFDIPEPRQEVVGETASADGRYRQAAGIPSRMAIWLACLSFAASSS